MKTPSILLFCIMAFALPVARAQETFPLQKEEVYESDFIRNTFYTWTTTEQVQDLAKNKVLLTKSKSETKGYAIFDVSLRDSLLKNNPIAQLLQQEPFAKKRFAWTNAWATVMGWENEKYGHHLIKIVLSDSAIIVKFNYTYGWGSSGPFVFYDLTGRELTTDYVLKHKNRIAVIYHVNKYKGKRREMATKKQGTFVHETQKTVTRPAHIYFREYVLVNESMIKDWSYGTAEIRSKIAAEINRLKYFEQSKEANQQAYAYRHTYWDGPFKGDTSDALAFAAATCFKNNHYLFNSKRIRSIISELEVALQEQLTEIKK